VNEPATTSPEARQATGLVDVHAHLTDEKLVHEVPAVLARAAAAGVTAILTVGTDLPTSRAALALAHDHASAPSNAHDVEPATAPPPAAATPASTPAAAPAPGQALPPDALSPIEPPPFPLPSVWAAVGVHPHDARTWPPDTAAELARLWADPRVVALGEMGLDYHYDFSPREVQREVFITQWDLAARLGAPAVVHVREAFADFFALIAGRPRPPQVLLHCFSGDLDTARRALDLGFDFSVGGPLTYPKSQDTRAIFAFLPLDRIHLETDCPYLAPQPRRGKVNEPSFLPMTLAVLSQVKQIDPAALARQLAANARRLFPKMRF
jgi:TatD DNase family protein